METNEQIQEAANKWALADKWEITQQPEAAKWRWLQMGEAVKMHTCDASSEPYRVVNEGSEHITITTSRDNNTGQRWLEFECLRCRSFSIMRFPEPAQKEVSGAHG